MVADVRLFASVLPDVHLEVRQLKVALGAAGVEAHEWFSLLFGLSRRHLRLSCDHMTRLLLPDLRDDEGRVSGHCHVDGSSTLVHVSVGWDTSGSIGYNLEGQRYVVLLLLTLRCSQLVVTGVGKGEDRVSMSAGHHHVLGHWWHRVMLQRHSGVD